MEIARKRRPIDILYGFFLLCHPGPVFMHMIAVTLFALLASWPNIAWPTLLLVFAAHLAMQLSIAILNDYCDRERDRLSTKKKPIVLGLIQPLEALWIGLLMIALMILFLLPLNPLALIVSLGYLALGQGYNLGLKSTPLSGVVFALMMPLIPVYAFVGMGRVSPFLFWLIPTGALLGIVLNLANSLPDIEDDTANRARTLAVVLGLQGSFIASLLLLVLTALLVGMLAMTQIVSAQSWLLVPTITFTLLAVGALFLFVRPQRSMQTRKLFFYSVTVLCLVLAVGWLISILAV